MEIIIISGRSGAGKSVALRALEDMGYYCVDNLPLDLLPQLTNILAKTQTAVAISLDIRNLPHSSADLDKILTDIQATYSVKIIFLDSDRSTLIRRYSDSRRLHPLSAQDLPLESAIDLEYQQLEPLIQHANFIIDTAPLSTHSLSERLREVLRGNTDKELKIVVESFGFKYGIPLDADYVFDVRFLPNPYYNEKLRPLTGNDKPIQDFVMGCPQAVEFMDKLEDMINFLIPNYILEGKNSLVIAVGCTGGKHRSVTLANELYRRLSNKDYGVKIEHRDIMLDSLRKK